MKLNKFVYLLLLSFLFTACEDTATTIIPDPVSDPVPLQIGGLKAVGYNSQILLEWDQTTDTDIDYYAITVSPASPNPPVVVSSTKRWITGLDNDVTYTLRVTAVDLKGQLGPLSNPVTARPRTGSSDVTAALAHLNAEEYEETINSINDSFADVENNVLTAESIDLLHNIRGWAFERLGNGINSDESYNSALADFKQSTHIDSYAGRAVIGYLLSDFTTSIQGAELIKDSIKITLNGDGVVIDANPTYVNEVAVAATTYSYNHIMISGAMSAFLSNNFTKCAEYLDLVEFVKVHSTIPQELYDDLMRVTSEFQDTKLQLKFVEFSLQE